MKKFTIKSSIVITFVIILHLLASFFADGNLDSFYLRFTSKKQKNLILGTSKAAQGLQPAVFDSVFSRSGIKSDMFNFSFTAIHSPYGPVYYNAIKEKLDTSSNDGIFILNVDPWSISSTSDAPNNINLFVEKESVLNDLKKFNSKPNFDYLLNGYGKGWGRIFVKKIEVRFLKKILKKNYSYSYLHNDGWLEIFVPMDSTSIQKRISKKIILKNKLKNEQSLSEVRYEYLSKTIDLLNDYGKVFLLRLPVHNEIAKIENSYCPNFDSLMNCLVKENQIDYFTFFNTSNNYSYTDGNHLYKTSGKEISQKIAQKIASELENNKLANARIKNNK